MSFRIWSRDSTRAARRCGHCLASHTCVSKGRNQQLINPRELGVSSRYYLSSPCPRVQPAECVAVWPLDGDLDLGQMFDPTLALVIWWNPHLPTPELHPLEPDLILVPIVEVSEKPHTLKHKSWNLNSSEVTRCTLVLKESTVTLLPHKTLIGINTLTKCPPITLIRINLQFWRVNR